MFALEVFEVWVPHWWVVDTGARMDVEGFRIRGTIGSVIFSLAEGDPQRTVLGSFGDLNRLDNFKKCSQRLQRPETRRVRLGGSGDVPRSSKALNQGMFLKSYGGFPIRFKDPFLLNLEELGSI